MADVGWQFPAILIAAMIISSLFTLQQQRRYAREVSRLAEASQGSEDALVTGRGRTFRGGAVVVLLVDVGTREIITARGMVGATVFARFKERPELLGPIDGAADRARTKQMAVAITQAIAQLPKRRRDDEAANQVRRSSGNADRPTFVPRTGTSARPVFVPRNGSTRRSAAADRPDLQPARAS